MARAKILYINDDLDAGDLWNYALTQAGFEVFLFSDPNNAMTWREENVSDMLLVCEFNGALDGVAFVEQIRPEVGVPILLTTPGDARRVLAAYQAGVDECIALPVLPALLLAKVNAWLRHSATVPTTVLHSITRGPFELNPGMQEVIVNGRHVSLTNLEFRLFHLLISHPNQVLQAQTIVDRVWRYSSEAEGKVLTNLVYRLRRKIEPDPLKPEHIVSITGGGYMFQL